MGCKVNVSSDKIILVSGGELFTNLIALKHLDFSLNGKTDKVISLDGNKLLSFTVGSDKIVSLVGSVGESLLGTKNNTTLTGNLSTLVTLMGNAPCTFFHIHCDTTYYSADDGDVTCDRD